MDNGTTAYFIDQNNKIPENNVKTSSDKGQHLVDLERIIDEQPLEPSSPVPLYAQLAERLSAYITSLGPDGAGTLFPSESECINLFKVSRPTVRQAISKLNAQGLVRKERGRGTFICDPQVVHDISHIFEEDMQAAHRKVEFKLLEHGFVTPTPTLLDIFGNETQRLYRVLRLRSIAGRVLGIEERFFPERFKSFLTPKILIEHNVFTILKLCTKTQAITGVNAIRAIKLDARAAQLTEATEGSAALTRETTYFVKNNVPVMYGIVTFLADRYQLRFKSTIDLSKSGKAQEGTAD